MYGYMRKALTGFALLIYCQPLFSQRLSNVKASVSGSRVQVTYDLAAGEEGQKFRISLYGSHDNYGTPLKMVTGDAGDRELVAGTGKTIGWDGNELRSFSGPITFEVRAEVISPPLTILSPASGDKFKKGSVIEVRWSKTGGGTLELQRNGVTVSKMGEGSGGKLAWTLSGDAKPGSGYKIKFTSGGETVMSGEFKVAAKYPFALKAGAVAVVGVVAYLIFGGEKDEPLPLPPDPQ